MGKATPPHRETGQPRAQEERDDPRDWPLNAAIAKQQVVDRWGKNRGPVTHLAVQPLVQTSPQIQRVEPQVQGQLSKQNLVLKKIQQISKGKKATRGQSGLMLTLSVLIIVFIVMFVLFPGGSPGKLCTTL